MRVSKILLVGAAVLASSLVLASGNVVGHWKGKIKITGTPTPMGKAYQQGKMGKMGGGAGGAGGPGRMGGGAAGGRGGPGGAGRMGGGGGGGRMGGGNFDPSKMSIELTLNANKTYTQKMNFGDRKNTSEGTWSIAGNKLTITPKTRDGKPVQGRGAEPRVMTVSADGKSIINERPGRGGMSMKTVYTKG